MKTLTALDTLQEELHKIQIAQEACINDYGIVVPIYKYKYSMLVEQANEIKNSIDWLKNYNHS